LILRGDGIDPGSAPVFVSPTLASGWLAAANDNERWGDQAVLCHGILGFGLL